MSSSSRQVVVGYLGPRGTFSEQAALVYKNQLAVGTDVRIAELRSFDSILSLILKTDEGAVDVAVVPLENSLEGSVALTLDMMAHEVDLQIAGEIIVPVRHNLLGREGVAAEEITEVISHPQALGQCSAFLRRCLPKARLVTASSTAEAARLVASMDGVRVAIGTEVAAGVYGLSILARDIQDNHANATRFCVLAQNDREPTGDDKTSIVFSPRENRAGVLYEQLYVFASRNIDLTRIESRPAKRILGEYLFFLDVAGHRQMPEVCEALDHVRQNSSFFRLLGSYPRWHEDQGDFGS
ncbi:MAG: prephenate dehydratase [Firmicutes bacterium]|nr:prephenate dehydratase [Bacillota bacterium]